MMKMGWCYQWWVLLFLMSGCEILQKVSSLKCYECAESEPNSCGKMFQADVVTITDCQYSIYTTDTLSMKKEYACMLLEEIDVASNLSTFTRRCSVKNLNDTCENIVLKNEDVRPQIRTNCRQCETDLCNSSTILNIRIISSVVLLLVTCFV
ncbi:unnamed protein product [Ceutorhynchus assimilis]|uniref:Protein sleepless n=1 Tax=Ceutorhynchus assimilis TaxID=467358 RepID=A0A9N9MV73_9CUCU|nr:unnamed protein product [Ceutorhynchus assimilis]